MKPWSSQLNFEGTKMISDLILADVPAVVSALTRYYGKLAAPFAAVGLATMIGTIWKLFHQLDFGGLKDQGSRRKSSSKEALDARKPPELWNTVLLFPDRTPNEPGSQTSKLLKYIDEAKFSIRITMYLASFQKLEQLLGKKFKQGLIVEVITDFDTLTAHYNGTIKSLMNHGVPVRVKTSEHLLHHKFIIIDEEAVMTGSLNWTKAGITGNWENVLVTTDPRFVQPYMEEFRKLWVDFEDASNLIAIREGRVPAKNRK